MHDGTIATSKLLAYTLWGLCACGVGAAWITLVIGHVAVAHMLGLTSAIFSAGAAVAHVRHFSLTTQRIVRTVCGSECQREHVADRPHALR